MSEKKRLQLKTPLRNLMLTLSGDINSANKEEELCVTLGRNKEYSYKQVVFTWNEIRNCRLDVRNGDCSLWVGRSSFDVRPEDVELIATTFGIRIDKKDEGASA